jgi:hypothetical protein
MLIGKKYLKREIRTLVKERNKKYLKSPPSIITVIKPRKISCTRHKTSMGRMKNAYRILSGKHD